MARNVTQKARLRPEPHGSQTAAVARSQSDIRQLRPGDAVLHDQLHRALDHPPAGQIGSLFLGEPPGARGSLGHEQIS
jgi:hypothetical protein